MKLTHIFIPIAVLLSGCGDTWRVNTNSAKATQPPLQTELTYQDKIAVNKGADTLYSRKTKMTPQAKYKITAYVLARKRYLTGTLSSIAPVDLVLGWGPMSDPTLLYRAKLSISQGTRNYRWEVPSFDILPRSIIEKNSANVHMIPLSDEVRDQLLAVKVGDVIVAEGSLVNVVDETGVAVNSSLTRDDTGAGSCEIFAVKSLTVLR